METAPRDATAPSTPADVDVERALRPTALDDFIGQKKIKDNLRVFVTAALQRGEALDHVILSGPPGLGKTTLSFIIAEEMGAEIKTTSGRRPRQARQHRRVVDQPERGRRPVH